MSKLTKQQAKLHAQACDLMATDKPLSWDDKDFILTNWREDANHVNSAAGAFFTPLGMAFDAVLEMQGPRILDLCAGIGALSFAFWTRFNLGCAREAEITCVEINPDYVEVGKKILPNANWITASVFDMPSDLGRFDTAIANPPFGRVKADGKPANYKGADFEYRVIDKAMDYSNHGVFIIPQSSANFSYSGRQDYRDTPSEKVQAFLKATGLEMTPNCGIDTAIYDDEWHGVKPRVEIVCVEGTRLSRRPEGSHQPPSKVFQNAVMAEPAREQDTAPPVQRKRAAAPANPNQFTLL